MFADLNTRVLPQQIASGRRWDFLRFEIWEDSGRIIGFPAFSETNERIDVAGSEVVCAEIADAVRKLDRSAKLDDDYSQFIRALVRQVARMVHDAATRHLQQPYRVFDHDGNVLASKWELRSGVLHTLTDEGAVLGVHQPIGSAIVQVLPSGCRLILREDYYSFPAGVSNVYCLDSQLRLLWNAELPSADDVYANPLVEDSQGLRCASWRGITCTLDPETGKIVSRQLTK
jgi:hypothetical protein